MGLQRYEKETSFGLLPGEPVATDRKLQREYLHGERCVGCRIMVLAY